MTAAVAQHIYLSPHLDDAVLSCGATIYSQTRAGEWVTVITVMAGSAPNALLTEYARELRDRWGYAQDPIAQRRQEDLQALAHLGAQAHHLPFLDCPYRQHPESHEPLYPTEASIFGELHQAESSFHLELLRALMPMVPAEAGVRIYAPLAVGHHVDHLLVRRVAVALLKRGYDVTFYEDYPYAGDEGRVLASLSGARRTWWSMLIAGHDQQALEAKWRAISCYRSQLSTFWDDLTNMRRQVRAFALHAGRGRYGERFWRLAPAALKSPLDL